MLGRSDESLENDCIKVHGLWATIRFQERFKQQGSAPPLSVMRKVSLHLNKHLALNTYEEMMVLSYATLISVLGGGEFGMPLLW